MAEGNAHGKFVHKGAIKKGGREYASAFKIAGLLELDDIGGLWAALPANYLELDPLALGEGLEALVFDG